MKKIRVIIKRPDELYGHVCNISNSLENLQKTVGGYIETVYLTDDVVVICNEEGLLKNLPYNMKLHDQELVGTIIVCGIEGDELTDLVISFDEWKYVVDVFNSELLYAPNNHMDLLWHVIEEENPDTFPKTKDYLILSFSNFTLPCIGRCEGNEDEGFTFYEGDDEKSLASYGLFVNAWMPLPERMVADDGMD